MMNTGREDAQVPNSSAVAANTPSSREFPFFELKNQFFS
jgi:hypothetical protein